MLEEMTLEETKMCLLFSFIILSIVITIYHIGILIINRHVWKGDLIEIDDGNLIEYGQQYFILFKIPDSKELYAVSKNKDAVIADFYVGKSQFKKVI